MSIKDNYSIRSIPKEQTYEWLLKKHYAHRIPSISYAFGLYDKRNILQGVCTLGTPLCSQLQGICGDYIVVELNRLVVIDGLLKNTLSYFVSSLLNQLPKPLVVVSYSDTAQNHHGYIYQATNFIYTGLGSIGSDWMVKGLENMHHASIEDSVGRYEYKTSSKTKAELLREKYGDRLYKMPRDNKHRYVYFCADKASKREMYRLLKYKQLPYPKGDNKRYDASYKPRVQGVLI